MEQDVVGQHGAHTSVEGACVGVCTQRGAEYEQVSDERTNHRNGYRGREWDSRAGTIELAVPKLRQGSYFPH